jgi:hypothetical protein
VYIVERLAARIAGHWPQVVLRHAALSDASRSIRTLTLVT